jgi:hypothetical protein
MQTLPVVPSHSSYNTIFGCYGPANYLRATFTDLYERDLCCMQVDCIHSAGRCYVILLGSRLHTKSTPFHRAQFLAWAVGQPRILFLGIAPVQVFGRTIQDGSAVSAVSRAIRVAVGGAIRAAVGGHIGGTFRGRIHRSAGRKAEGGYPSTKLTFRRVREKGITGSPVCGKGTDGRRRRQVENLFYEPVQLYSCQIYRRAWVPRFLASENRGPGDFAGFR